ncbi:hypothetical protein KIN20_016082 [Parelaphostrongylus tenuis]|uniref:Phosphoribulokinase/uridine kinase domain-containing protein n=1 Tax=Parelaphostrongylus tenuis TaxID=148309 RepID=A0AAD5QQF7_PARTN|nr:hypothetical protein KIN20_016082 [Parelaphostrongylus tenuis]
MGKARLPCIIGVAGGPSSGKSLVMEKIMERLETLNQDKKKQVITIPMESFYKELNGEERIKAEIGEYDFDHPSAFDFDKLAETISQLEDGKSVTLPKYDFLRSTRKGSLHLEPADVIIVEGILIFYDARLRNKFAMKLFVDADADIRLARRESVTRVSILIVSLVRQLPFVISQSSRGAQSPILREGGDEHFTLYVR